MAARSVITPGSFGKVSIPAKARAAVGGDNGDDWQALGC